MKQTNAAVSPRKSEHSRARANHLAANCRAAALAPTIRELIVAGFVSQQALTDELNRRGIPTALGGRWHRTSVGKILRRLGLITKGTINNGLANKKAADARAKTLASTVRALQVKGLVSLGAIARELNAREIRTGRGGNWHPSGVSRLLQRLERLDRPSNRVT
jgi:hypothetical protein